MSSSLAALPASNAEGEGVLLKAIAYAPSHLRMVVQAMLSVLAYTYICMYILLVQWLGVAQFKPRSHMQPEGGSLPHRFWVTWLGGLWCTDAHI